MRSCHIKSIFLSVRVCERFLRLEPIFFGKLYEGILENRMNRATIRSPRSPHKPDQQNLFGYDDRANDAGFARARLIAYLWRGCGAAVHHDGQLCVWLSVVDTCRVRSHFHTRIRSEIEKGRALLGQPAGRQAESLRKCRLFS